MRNRKKKDRIKLLFLILLGLTVGYALLGTTLKINGIAGIKSNTFSIHWDSESVDVTEGSVESSDPVVSENDTKVSFTTTLELPGDFYEFTIDAVNDGTVDGMISDIKKSIKIGTENATLPEYIKFSVTYADGASLAKNHYLKKRVDATHPTKETYKVRLEYLESATVLPDADKTYTIDYDVDYQQADDNAIDRPICLTESSETSIYAFDAETGTITGFSSNYNNETELVLPCKIDDIEVKTIGEGAFANTNITSVIFNSNLENILSGAFYQSKLTSLFLPDSVKEIGIGSFYKNEIETLTLSENLETVNTNSFAENRIKVLSIPNKIKSINEHAFISNEIEELDIPSTVKTIGTAAFNFNKIKILNLHEGLETINSAAFANNEIEELDIPSTVKVLQQNVFTYNKIKVLTLHEGLETIEGASFGFNDLREITIPSTVTNVEGVSFPISSNQCTGINNLNLTTIHNKTGRAFAWNAILGDQSNTTTFVTGTVNASCSKTVEITN